MTEEQDIIQGKTKTILFVFSDFGRGFYLKIIEGINKYASVSGYDMVICTDKSCEKFMRSSMSDGCIILDAHVRNDTIISAAEEGYPIVVMDRLLEAPNVKSVIMSNIKSMTNLMSGIVDRGYRRFAFISGPEHTEDSRERFQAFSDVLSAGDIAFDNKMYFAGNYLQSSGYEAARIFLAGGSRPEAIVCANDDMAIGAIKALEESGLRIPRDIAVTGFDNIPEAESAGLTTVSIPDYERGYLAAFSLIDNIRGKNNFETVNIPTSVVWRHTVAAMAPDSQPRSMDLSAIDKNLIRV